MYDEFAYLWPLISDPEDYAEEASYWRDALRAALGPGRHHILELGVGGGNNLYHLTSDFEATAVDISESMLANSIQLNPAVEHHVGDMRSVRLGRTFEAVIIHDAIDYLLTEADIQATLATARAHLDPGGVFITAPDWYRETFPGASGSCKARSKDGLELTVIEYTHDPDPTDTTIETIFVYIIKERGRLQVEEDRHTTGLFSRHTWLRLMMGSGFEVKDLPYPVHEDGREAYLFVGTLRSSR